MNARVSNLVPLSKTSQIVLNHGEFGRQGCLLTKLMRALVNELKNCDVIYSAPRALKRKVAYGICSILRLSTLLTERPINLRFCGKNKWSISTGNSAKFPKCIVVNKEFCSYKSNNKYKTCFVVFELYWGRTCCRSIRLGIGSGTEGPARRCSRRKRSGQLVSHTAN